MEAHLVVSIDTDDTARCSSAPTGSLTSGVVPNVPRKKSSTKRVKIAAGHLTVIALQPIFSVPHSPVTGPTTVVLRVTGIRVTGI